LEDLAILKEREKQRLILRPQEKLDQQFARTATALMLQRQRTIPLLRHIKTTFLTFVEAKIVTVAMKYLKNMI
jgi:hypothetical protein